MIYLYCILGFLGYCFIGKVFLNFSHLFLVSKEENKTKAWYKFNECCSSAWIITIPIILLYLIIKTLAKLPFKFADLICDPSNYKFRIKLEKK